MTKVIKATAYLLLIVAVVVAILDGFTVIVISLDRADPVQTASTEAIVKNLASDPFEGEAYLEFLGYNQVSIMSFDLIVYKIVPQLADWTVVNVQSYRMCDQDFTTCTTYIVQDCHPVLDDGWQNVSGIYVRTDTGRVAFQGSEFNQVTESCK